MAAGSAERSNRPEFAANPEPGAGYVARVREIAPALAAAAAEIDAERRLPEPIIEALIERGLTRMLLPKSLGGAELPPAQYVPVIEELAKIDASAAWCVNQTSGCSMTAVHLKPAIAREIFGGPRGILAWGPGPGEARVAPGGYRVTATWAFTSGAQLASWLGCHVPVVEADGTPRRHADGTPVVRTMLFPKSATEFTDMWHTIGLRGTASNQYAVKDLFVAEDYSVDVLSRRAAPIGQQGLLYRFSNLMLYASGFGGVALGIGRATLGQFIELARDKIPRGAQKTMRNNNLTQSEAARAEARLSSARDWLLHSLAEIADAVAGRGHITLDERMRIRLASTFAVHTSLEVVDMLYQAAGATAIFNENPWERRFRDIHSVAQLLQ
ncbi:MAG: acyl-CoA dehydrogenase family protein, partial [Alphaproteobacteria bacterium]